MKTNHLYRTNAHIFFHKKNTKMQVMSMFLFAIFSTSDSCNQMCYCCQKFEICNFRERIGSGSALIGSETSPDLGSRSGVDPSLF